MRHGRLRTAAVVVAVVSTLAAMTSGQRAAVGLPANPAASAGSTSTPIQHLVVIFGENISFDHYFGTYPKALNPPGEPGFVARPGTTTPNGLSTTLLTHNPNLSPPQRLDRSEALTCDQNHDYTAEQNAFDHGLMDQFVQSTNNNSAATRSQCVMPIPGAAPPPPGSSHAPDYTVMDYYDGNTTTALWNYAQEFALNDNSHSTTFGPSTPGALNLISGNTFGATCGNANTPGSGDPDLFSPASGTPTPPCPGTSTQNTPGDPQPQGDGTVISDPDQFYDVCSNPTSTAAMGGRNVGDLLNQQNVTWGWFNGGFSSPGYVAGNPASFDPTTVCTDAHYNIGAGPALDGRDCAPGSPDAPPPGSPQAPFCKKDYSAHHEPFQYYPQSSNPKHLPPATLAEVGRNGQANHQYDLKDFYAAVSAGNMPAVSFLKAPRFQDAHPNNSDPIDEQHFVVNTLNFLQRQPQWRSTAVVLLYDDSDGWYDHSMSTIAQQSQTQYDSLTEGPNDTATQGEAAAETGLCGNNQAQTPAGQQARCGYGPRQPLLVVSRWAKTNFVDSTLTDQSSVTRFIEDNWLAGQRIGSGSADAYAGPLGTLFDFTGGSHQPDAGRLFLDPVTGEPQAAEATRTN